MIDKFIIGGSEGGRVCAGGGFLQKDFVLNHLTFFEIGDKLRNGSDKFPIDGIGGALDKKRLPTRS